MNDKVVMSSNNTVIQKHISVFLYNLLVKCKIECLLIPLVPSIVPQGDEYYIRNSLHVTYNIRRVNNDIGIIDEDFITNLHTLGEYNVHNISKYMLPMKQTLLRMHQTRKSSSLILLNDIDNLYKRFMDIVEISQDIINTSQEGFVYGFRMNNLIYSNLDITDYDDEIYKELIFINIMENGIFVLNNVILLLEYIFKEGNDHVSMYLEDSDKKRLINLRETSLNLFKMPNDIMTIYELIDHIF